MNPSAKLYKALEQQFQNQFELDVGEGGFVLLTVISTIFQGQSRAERLRHIEPLIEQAGLQSGIVDLYTREEADNEVALPVHPASRRIFKHRGGRVAKEGSYNRAGATVNIVIVEPNVGHGTKRVLYFR